MLWISLRPLTRYHIRDYFTNCTTTGLENLLTSGSLHGSLSAIKIDFGQASDPVPVLSGVPQGSVLGPVLFLIFINDLPDNIRSSVCLFADDCVLYRNINSLTLTDCQILQDDLNSLALWETDWQMKFNVAKCHSVRVTRHLPSKQIQLTTLYTNKRWNRFDPPNTFGLLSLTTWNGVNMFLKSLVKQLRHFLTQFCSCTSAYKGSCIQNIGPSSAGVYSSYLASL